MQSSLFKSRHNVVSIVFFTYFVPILILSIYASMKFSTVAAWSILPIGLLMTIFGTLLFLVIMQKWEVAQPVVENKITPIDHDDSIDRDEKIDDMQQLQVRVEKELETVNEENKKLRLEKENLNRQFERIEQEFTSYKETHCEELNQKKIFLEEYQKTINEQREVIEKKQKQIKELESKVSDLNFEIRTLIELNEAERLNDDPFPEDPIPPFVCDTSTIPPPSVEQPVKVSESASHHLKRCIDIAQKVTSAGHFSNGFSRFGDPSVNNYVLDMRRLCDNLRSENSHTILLYSNKEKKLLFANNQTKNLLGWSSDKLIANFYDIVQEGAEEWQKNLSQLQQHQESHVRLLMKTKTGENILVHCILGMIPTGLFRSNIIAILQPA